MRTLFAIIFGIAILFLCSIIVSLIPISSMESLVGKHAKKHNITFVSKNIWTFRLIGLKATTNKFEYNFKIGENDVSGHGENFTYQVVNGDVYTETLLLQLRLAKNENISSLVENIQRQMAKKYYSFEIKKCIIEIYLQDDDGNYNLNDEILLNDVNFKKLQNNEEYSFNVSINKDQKTMFLLTIDNANRGNKELNAKIENDNTLCYVYNSQKGGNINCKIKNLAISIKNFSNDAINSEFANTIFDKYITFKANITHEKNNQTAIDGKMIVNNDVGDIKYNSIDNKVNITFNNIDFTKTSSEIKNSNFADESNDAIMMSGKENKILSNAKQKEILENINSLSKVASYAVGLFKKISLNLNVKVQQANIHGIPVQNFQADISKSSDDGIKINEITATFGESQSNQFSIRQNNSQPDNLLIVGKDINEFATLLNLNFFNKNINSNDFRITGEASCTFNNISINNANIYINGTKIINYNFSKTYNFEQKNIVAEKKISLQDININQYFDMQAIFKTAYDVFLTSQQQEMQDAVFFKELFNKRNQTSVGDVYKKTFIINNSTFYDKKINYLTTNYEDSNKITKLSIVSSGELADGEFTFELKNVNNQETIDSRIKATNVDLIFNNELNNDIKSATNRSLYEIFNEDKDYYIPSFIGLNGIFQVDIKNLFTQNHHCHNIKGAIKMHNGILETNEFLFKYKTGNVNINSSLSLQGRPEIQLAFSISGLKINDITTTSLDGFVSSQGIIKTYGFNPIKIKQNLNGSGSITVQNLKIPHFDLLHLSSEIMTNGIRRQYNYNKIITNKPLSFASGEGQFIINNGILRGDLSLSRELVSSNVIFEYGIFTNILRQMSGSFAFMAVRKPLAEPFPIYIPFACNGEPQKPECLVDWKQFDDTKSNI